MDQLPRWTVTTYKGIRTRNDGNVLCWIDSGVKQMAHIGPAVVRGMMALFPGSWSEEIDAMVKGYLEPVLCRIKPVS